MSIVRLLLILGLLLAGCAPKRAPEVSYYELLGDQAKRINTVTTMLSRAGTLPTPIVDAQFVEEKIGDDELGPADYRAFTVVVVAPESVATWQSALTRLETAPRYAEPSQPYSWWLKEDDFAGMEYYAADTLTGRANGWVALDPPSGTIYIYSFTS